MASQHCTLVIVPKEWYSWAVEQLRHVLQQPCAELIYLLSPPYPAELAEALAAAQALHPHLRVLHQPPLENPYAMLQRATEEVATRYAAFLGNDTFPTPGWLEELVAVAEARARGVGDEALETAMAEADASVARAAAAVAEAARAAETDEELAELKRALRAKRREDEKGDASRRESR